MTDPRPILVLEFSWTARPVPSCRIPWTSSNDSSWLMDPCQEDLKCQTLISGFLKINGRFKFLTYQWISFLKWKKNRWFKSVWHKLAKIGSNEVNLLLVFAFEVDNQIKWLSFVGKTCTRAASCNMSQAVAALNAAGNAIEFQQVVATVSCLYSNFILIELTVSPWHISTSSTTQCTLKIILGIINHYETNWMIRLLW